MARIEYDKYAAGIFNRTERYADKVRRHFESAVERLLELTSGMSLDEGEVFSFSSNRRVSREATDILRGLYSNVYQEIRSGITAEWDYANLSADALIRSIFGKVADSDHFAQYFARNQQAMDAFFSRTSAYGGLNLSQRVWNYTGQLKDEIELALSVAMGQGESASTISRQVRKFLREPDRLFRRVKDEKGNLKLSKRAAAYHPGRGVYRSSYKNAMRLTRTETNMAYRTADHLRWQQMDFVVGIEIRTSNHHPAPDICDDLKGRYPKEFKFVGRHPQCRCFAVPILAPLDDMLKWGRDVLDGKAGLDDFAPEQITDMPKAFNNWVKDNAERITTAEYQPYFIRDNMERVNPILSEAKASAMRAQMPYVPPTLEHIRNEFMIRGWDTEDMWENPATLARNFDLIGFKQKVSDLLKDYNIELGLSEFEIKNNGEWWFNIESKEPGAFKLTRTFYQRSDGSWEVHHSLFKLKQEIQGKGISREILKGLYDEYKRMGVRYITLDANLDIGGYAWARYGFNANSKRHALAPMNLCRNKGVRKAAQKVIDDYYQINGLPDWAEFPMHILTEKIWGRSYLLGSSWSGVLDLMNAEQVATFEGYLFRK